MVNLHGRYRLTPRLQLSAQVYNLLDADYATYGAFFEAEGVEDAGSPLPAHADPRTITPAAPRSVRVGLSYRW